jgi:hypothetical protein
MKYIFFLFLFFLTFQCSKPKIVLICGDHVCVNKLEAEQYFEKNLSIEVKIVEKKIKKEVNLIELNLKNNQNKKEVNIYAKKDTKNNLKTLSNNEISKIKKKIRNEKKDKKIVRKSKKIKEKNLNNKTINVKNNKIKNNRINKKQANIIVNKNQNNLVDICTILEKCSIDEISKYLLKQGKMKKFPDITQRP